MLSNLLPAETAASGRSDGNGNWFELFLAVRESIWRNEASSQEVPEPSLTSQVMRGGAPALFLNVPVAGQNELYLSVTGTPDVIHGAATWADVKLVAEDGSEQCASVT